MFVNKKFARKSGLNEQKKLVQEKKTYGCDTCTKSFAVKRYLK